MTSSSSPRGPAKPRMIPVPGHERAVAALDFLRESKLDRAKVGKNVVIIGAGNVGCDAAAEAARLGAESVTLIDIQAPASFGVERKHAEAAGAKFLWPRFTKAITRNGGGAHRRRGPAGRHGDHGRRRSARPELSPGRDQDRAGVSSPSTSGSRAATPRSSPSATPSAWVSSPRRSGRAGWPPGRSTTCSGDGKTPAISFPPSIRSG